MYLAAVELSEADRNLHRFVWCSDLSCEFQDYRMTCVTFGVTASAFVAIQPLQQTAMDYKPVFSMHILWSFMDI